MYFSMILSTFSEHLFFAEQFSIWLLTHLIPFCLYSNQTMIKAKLIIITHTYTQTHTHTHTHTRAHARARENKKYWSQWQEWKWPKMKVWSRRRGDESTWGESPNSIHIMENPGLYRFYLPRESRILKLCQLKKQFMQAVL